jgi:hypothetical protein
VEIGNSQPKAARASALPDGDDRLIVRVPGGLAVSLPRRLAPGQAWVGTVEWAVEATTVHRGIRTYDATGFAQFSLDQFTNEQTF